MLAAGSILDPLYRVIGWLLAFFYALPPHNLGVAIILMTIVVMLAQFPLIAKQTRSMLQMQRVQPEIKKIQQKYKDDRQKQNEELLKFYQENKINPLAGCLPLLIVLPIGMAVFRSFHQGGAAHPGQGIHAHIPRSGSFARLYTDLCNHAANVPDCGRAIAKRTPHAMYFLGINLNWSASQVGSKLSGHVIQWFPYYLLILLVIATGWYQAHQTQARQARQGGAAPNAQMQMMTRVLPIVFGLITYGLNAATTLYFVISNVWRIGQQHFVLNKMYEESQADTSGSKTPANGEGGSTGSGGGKRPPPGKPSARRDADGAADGGRPSRPAANAARRKKKRKR